MVICSDSFFRGSTEKNLINDLLDEVNLIISFETGARNVDPFRVRYIIFHQCLIASVVCNTNVASSFSNANVVLYSRNIVPSVVSNYVAAMK